MIIIMSPSKTQTLKQKENLTRHFPMDMCTKRFPNPQLCKKLTTVSKINLGKLLDIKGTLLENTFNLYRSFDSLDWNHAIGLYTGSVFQGFELSKYSKEQLEYVQNHFVILSAFYGALKPFDLIRPYRLDMNHSPLKSKNETLWEKEFAQLEANRPIINLASDEFSKTVKAPMIHIIFKETVDEKHVIKSTYAKIARGVMADYMIENFITEPDEIKKFDRLGYFFSEPESDESHYVFVRNEQ